MNKLTSTLAGLALVAGASIAPAFAQGAFSNLSTGKPFIFSFTPTGFTAINQLVNYNAVTGNGTTMTTGFLSLTGSSSSSSNLFTNTMLSFTPSSGGAGFTDTVPLTVIFPLGDGNFTIDSTQATGSGDQYNLTAAAVPEASTVLSFGALLALGGLAVLRRKTVAKSAA